MSHDPRDRHLMFYPSCEKCGDRLPSGAQEDDYGRIWCLECQANEAEAAYERQQESLLDGSTPTFRETYLAAHAEHQKAHKR